MGDLINIKNSHQLCFTVVTQSLSVIPNIFWGNTKCDIAHTYLLCPLFTWLFILLSHLFMCQHFLKACKFRKYIKSFVCKFHVFFIIMEWTKDFVRNLFVSKLCYIQIRAPRATCYATKDLNCHKSMLYLSDILIESKFC